MTWDEWLSRRTPAVRARIERLNGPHGPPANFIPRGWNPHKKAAPQILHVVPVRRFIAKFGREKYRSLPKSALVRDGHRKAVSYRVVNECC